MSRSLSFCYPRGTAVAFNATKQRASARRSLSQAKASRPAGESREGAALFGGGVWVPPNPPLRSASRQGSGRMSGVGT